MQGKPLYQVMGEPGEPREPRGSRRVEVYDSSIYHDDFGFDDGEAVKILTREVEAGLAAGYLNFKVKIGRGARWMPMDEGFKRDILAIHTVRKAAGPAAKVLIDANDGGTVNSAKEILRACADDRVFWFEEPFAEARPLNEDLKEWMEREGLRTLIADGEYHAPPDFFDLMKDGLVDVLIADFRLEGASWWKAAAARIEPWGRRAAPHCWASVIDTYARAHFVATLPHFEILEIDPADTSPLVLDGWQMKDSHLIVPDTPGIGVDIDPAVLERGISNGGYRVRLKGAR
jgi:L-alanine-DL-glutamate epimerase-like enolase superfamily enzyme